MQRPLNVTAMDHFSRNMCRGPQNMLFSKGIQLSSDQNPAYLPYIRDYAPQLYRDYLEPL